MIKRHKIIMSSLLYEYCHSRQRDLDEHKKEKDFVCSLGGFLCNKWGINFCSIESVELTEQEDGQLIDININLIPNSGNVYNTEIKNIYEL